MNTTIPRKRNIAGYRDESGRFRPIRSPEYVGTPKRKATKTDKRKYSRAKAGDLGKKRQELALEDVFDREVRKQKEANERFEKKRQAEWREIEKDVSGTRSEGRRKSETLMQFVRSAGGIRRTYRHGGRKAFGKRSGYDTGEINRLSAKETGRRGLTTDKGGKDLDSMFKAAREAGYPVTDIDDMMSRIEDEAAGGKAVYPTHGYLDYRDNPKKKVVKRNSKPKTKTANSRSHIASAAELKALQAASRQLASRVVNGKLKRNPVGWFREVSPVTPEAVKKLYRRLAAQWHPDKAGGDVRKMQEINADYEKAIKIAAGNEGNEKRASAERTAAKPLREAIEFAVTLPDDVDVVIRGLWLWLQGNTYKAREQIKSFRSSDGNKFKWASQKKAWFFAAVPSSNRRGEMSFDEIDALHGRELVNERKRRLGLRSNPKKQRRNPIDPLSTFTTAAVGLASALQIKEYFAQKRKQKANPKPAAPKRGKTTANPRKRAKNPTLAEINRCRRIVAAADRENQNWVDVPIIRERNPKGKAKRNPDRCLRCRKMTPEGIYWLNGGLCDKCDKQLRPPLARVAKKTRTVRKKNAPAKVPHRRTFSMFNGRPATKMKAMPVSGHAPAQLDQLGDLIELKLTNGQILKLNPKRFKLCAARGKLWITGGKFAKANPATKTNVLNPIAEIAHVVYGTTKPHHGDSSYTHYIHKLGEESGHRPILAVDQEGFPVIRGGKYKIEARGIVN